MYYSSAHTPRVSNLKNNSEDLVVNSQRDIVLASPNVN